MKIKLKLQIVALLPGLIFIMLGVLYYTLNNDLNRNHEQDKVASEVNRTVSSLITLSYEYNLSGNERTAFQWRNQQVELGDLLAKSRLLFPEASEGNQLDDLERGLKESGKRFDELHRFDVEGHADEPSRQLRERMVANLLLELHGLSGPAEHLHTLSHGEIINIIRHVNQVSALLLLSLLALFPLLLLVLGRSVSRPLEELQLGMREMAEGKLEQHLEITSDDEIGQLAMGFNEMAEKLNMVTVSRATLLDEIAERRRVEEELRANHQTLAKQEVELIEAQRLAHIGSWDWDAVRDVIWWSEEYYRIYGIDPGQTPPNYQEHLRAYTTESATRLDAAVQQSMATGESYTVDLELAQPTAVTRWIVARGEVKRDADGKICGLRGTAQNITERKNIEARITALNAELEQRVAERTGDLKNSQQALMNIVDDLGKKSMELETANAELQSLDRLKSMFVASMSHELRTPLNSIIGFSTIILEEWLGPLNAEQRAKLAIVLRTGKHLLTLINDVIDVSKIEAGKLESRFEDFELGEVVTEAIDLVRREGEEKGLTFRDATTPMTMHSDRRRFFQCLVNLLGNAVKFSNRGEVAVVSSMVAGGGDGADRLRISVRDCGIGIPESELPRLFTPFTRIQSELRDTVKGTGLGLYLVKKITEEILQGQVGVESTPGQGSMFYLTVPLRIEERSPAVEPPV